MIFKVFSILDTKADLFKPPFFMSTVGEAVRAFQDLANDEKSLVSRHAEDFRLYCIGTFDDATARFVGADPLQALGYASDYRAQLGVPVGVSHDQVVPLNGRTP